VSGIRTGAPVGASRSRCFAGGGIRTAKQDSFKEGGHALEWLLFVLPDQELDRRDVAAGNETSGRRRARTARVQQQAARGAAHAEPALMSFKEP
jgi:hypothetical protein